MLAYHGDPDLKTSVLALLAEHREADRLVKGKYWEHGKGCAVGCTLESIRVLKGQKTIVHDSHALYETYLGVPRVLARLEDALFESLPNGEAQAWPERFIQAIAPGADLSMVWPKFLHNLLTDLDGGVQIAGKRRLQSLAVIQAVSDLFERWIDGAMPSQEEWRQARAAAAAYSDAADAAVYSAADAAYSAAAAAYSAAAYSAYSAAACSAATYSADAADAADAAYSAAAYSADAAAYSAYSAAACSADAADVAYSANERRRQADVLIRILEEAK